MIWLIMDFNDSSSSEELFPIEGYRDEMNFNYDDPDLYSGIMKAVVANDLENVKQLVNKGMSLRSVDNHGNSALHIAVIKCSEDDVKILEFLLSKGAEINARNFYGFTPLLISVKLAKHKPTYMLLQAGADVNISTNEDVTPLHLSVRYSPEISKILILAEADIDSSDFNGDTPLHDAIVSDKLESVCLLLYYGADTTITNSGGLTPFMHCLALNNSELADELFEYVIDFNLSTTEGMSTLFLAITGRYPRIIEIIERGADVNYLQPGPPTNVNVFQLGVEISKDVFEYMWNLFDYENAWHRSTENILSYVLRENLTQQEKIDRIGIVLSSEKRNQIYYLTEFSEGRPMIKPIFQELDITCDLFEEYCTILLTNNLKLYKDDLESIYFKYGNTKFFNFLLHMEFKNWYNIGCVRMWIPLMIFELKMPDIFEIVFYDNHHILSTLITFRFESIFDYWIDRSVISFLHRELSSLGLNPYTRAFLEYIKLLPDVPNLQDLAIRSSRSYLCQRYQIKSCMQFYTVLKHLEISDNLKKLVSYQVPIYKYDSIPEFLKFRKIMEQLGKEVDL